MWMCDGKSVGWITSVEGGESMDKVGLKEKDWDCLCACGDGALISDALLYHVFGLAMLRRSIDLRENALTTLSRTMISTGEGLPKELVHFLSSHFVYSPLPSLVSIFHS